MAGHSAVLLTLITALAGVALSGRPGAAAALAPFCNSGARCPGTTRCYCPPPLTRTSTRWRTTTRRTTRTVRSTTWRTATVWTRPAGDAVAEASGRAADAGEPVAVAIPSAPAIPSHSVAAAPRAVAAAPASDAIPDAAPDTALNMLQGRSRCPQCRIGRLGPSCCPPRRTTVRICSSTSTRYRTQTLTLRATRTTTVTAVHPCALNVGHAADLRHRFIFDPAAPGHTFVDCIGGAPVTVVDRLGVKFPRTVVGNIARNVLSVNGTASGLTAPGSVVSGLGKSEFTLTLWARMSPLRPFSQGWERWELVSDRGYADSGPYVAVRVRNVDDSVTWELGDGGSGSGVVAVNSTSAPALDGRWHFLAFSRRGRRHSIYVDGVLEVWSEGTQVADVADTGYPLGIGYSPAWHDLDDGPMRFRGQLDDVRLYGAQLDGAAMREIMAAYLGFPVCSAGCPGNASCRADSAGGLTCACDPGYSAKLGADGTLVACSETACKKRIGMEDNNMLHRWVYDEGLAAGTLFDCLGTAQPSVVNPAGLSFPDDTIIAAAKKVAQSDGTAGLRVPGTAAGVATNDLIVTMWVKMGPPAPGQTWELFSNRPPATAPGLYPYVSIVALHDASLGSPVLSFTVSEEPLHGTGTARLVASPTLPVFDSSWHLLGFSRNGTTLTISVDRAYDRGVQVASGSWTAWLQDNGWPMRIADGMVGRVDDVRLYGLRRLDSARLDAMMAAYESP
ncbi:concanavalin A-like lectin/glucanase domain-containing protein [Hyaloraphidium curvatum]|nr:concanavalin A-like lectin/glucanase domain-containing protein [Hyaloraphidium curvatum]